MLCDIIYAILKEGETKYSDSEEFKRLKYDFGEGKIKKDEAAMFLKQRCNSLSNEVMDREEYLKCLGILSEDVGYFYSEDERLTFMYNYNGELCRRSNRNDIIAYFDRYARGFSDRYILRIINMPSNPKNYRTQESDEIDRQISLEIKKYNQEVERNNKISSLLATIRATALVLGITSPFIVPVLFPGSAAAEVICWSVLKDYYYVAALGFGGSLLFVKLDEKYGEMKLKKEKKK